jgi:hypothetical protein
VLGTAEDYRRLYGDRGPSGRLSTLAPTRAASSKSTIRKPATAKKAPAAKKPPAKKKTPARRTPGKRG